MNHNDESRYYKLPNGVAMQLGDVEVEVVDAVSLLTKEQVEKVETKLQQRLQPAGAVEEEDLESESVNVPVEDAEEKMATAITGLPTAQFPMVGYPMQPQQPMSAEEQNARDVGNRLNVAQVAISTFMNLRHHQVQVLGHIGEDFEEAGEPYEGESWKNGDTSWQPKNALTFTQAEMRLYEAGLNFMSDFIEKGQAVVPTSGDPSVLNAND